MTKTAILKEDLPKQDFFSSWVNNTWIKWIFKFFYIYYLFWW